MKTGMKRKIYRHHADLLPSGKNFFYDGDKAFLFHANLT
jgi:hypothetical protein